MADEPLAIPLDEIQVDEKLHFIEEPVEIMDREVKRLKQSRIPIVKECWNYRRGPEFTWEREDQMQKKYPHLFSNSAPAAEPVFGPCFGGLVALECRASFLATNFLTKMMFYLVTVEIGLLDFGKSSDSFKVKIRERTLAENEVSLLMEIESRVISPSHETFRLVDHTIMDELQNATRKRKRKVAFNVGSFPVKKAMDSLFSPTASTSNLKMKTEAKPQLLLLAIHETGDSSAPVQREELLPRQTQPIRMEMFPFGHSPEGNGDVFSVCFIRENNNNNNNTLPFAFGGFGVYCAGDVLNYAFLASRLQSAGLQTKLLQHTGIISPGPIFDDALSVFNISMKTDLLCNPSEIAAPKVMKKMADIYFTRVTKNADSTFSLSPRQMALWTSQMEDHTSDWLRTVPISGLGQTMNACSKVFVGDIYGDHVVSCIGIISIKHRHNVVRYTLVNICYRYGISAGKEVDIGLDRGRDKSLRPADMLLYSWDGGLDRKRGKYMAKCAAIGYGFLPFSFSSLGELEADAVTLLKRIWKFSMTQDIGARVAVHIFNKINFAITKGVGAQIVSRLPSNLL
ncbi:hypothetical protein Tco_0777215 [Tanacetum coccineum]